MRNRLDLNIQYQQAVDLKADWFRIKNAILNNCNCYLVFLKGPDNSPFEGRWFRIYLTYSRDNFSVNVRFDTKIHHPNVNSQTGLANYSKRNDNDTLIQKLGNIRQLLSHPDVLNPANDAVKDEFLNNPDFYAAIAKLIAEIHAPQNLKDLGWNDEIDQLQDNDQEEEENKQE